MPLNHSLRLIHTSDWHLGHELFGHSREAEHDAFLNWLVEQLAQEQADALVVAGDVYDVAHPPVAAMERLYRFLREATDRCPHLQIVMIGGNHDSAARINLPAPLLDQGRVHLLGALPRTREGPQFDKLCVPLRNRDGAAAAWAVAVPYCRPGDLGARSLTQLFAEAIDHAEARAGGLPLIACGHLHVAGGEISEHSERRITIGGEEAEAAAMFDARLAYAALGHLHRPQQIKGETLIRYSGSPIPLSAAERGYRHSIAVVDVGPGSAEARLIEVPRTVPFLALPEGGPRPIEEVEQALATLELDDGLPRNLHPFLEVAVRVEGPEPGLQARVLAALEGKPVRLTRIVRHTARQAESGQITVRQQDLAELNPEAVFGEMYQSKFGNPVSEDLLRVFQTLLVEAQGENA